MIFKSASPLSPNVTMTIDNVPVNYMTLQKITFEEKEGMHTVAMLDFIGMDPQLIHQYLDVPITFSIEIKDRPAIKFNGYITFLEPIAKTNDGVVNKSPFQITTVYCFGASYKMKSKHSRTWENVTISDITTEIADKYMFSVSVPNNSYKFSRLAQKSQSDWQFLVQAAKALGYSVIMDGTHIHVWSGFQSIYRNISYTMLTTIRGLRGDVSPQPGQILKFEARIGAVTTDGVRTPDTVYLLDKDGSLKSVTNHEEFNSSGYGTPVQSQFYDTVNINADTYDMAKTLVYGRLTDKFPMTACVETTFDPSVRPGGVVRINEYNTEFDGFWYVVSVCHEMTQSSIITKIEIARDSLGATVGELHTSLPYTAPPEPAYRNGMWVSAYDYVDIYS